MTVSRTDGNERSDVVERGRRIRLLVMTVMPSPYQRELFAAMAAHPGLDVRVVYYTSSSPDRQWGRPRLPASSRVLPGLALHSISTCCCLNPTVVSEIGKGAYDLAVVGDYFTLTAQLAMRYLTWRGIPWVFWGEAPGMSPRGPVGRGLRRLAQQPIRRHAAAVAAIGTRAAALYRRILPPDVPVFNIPYHCDLAPYLAITRPRRSGMQSVSVPEVRFLFSGQLIHRKGVDVLLRAFERVCETGAAASLTIVGDGPDRHRCRRLIGPEWRPRVRFLGFHQPDDLPNVFAESDVFVLPSRYDGWGVVVNEALAAGMPIIATSAVGAGADLIEPGRNGFVVAPGDVDALTAAMKRFVAEPTLVHRLGTRSREIAGDWTTARGAERWFHLCRYVLGRRCPRGATTAPEECVACIG